MTAQPDPAIVRDQSFGNVSYQNGDVVEDTTYAGCTWYTFNAGRWLGGDVFKERPRLSNVSFQRCRSGQWDSSGVALYDVTFANVRGDISIQASAIRHVRLEGRVKLLYLKLEPARLASTPTVDAQNEAFHAAVDWMLDIRGAELADYPFGTLDPTKVWIDPSRQALISASSLAGGADHLRTLDLSSKVGGDLLYALDNPKTQVRLTEAGLGRRARDEDLRLIELLHERNLTEPTYAPADTGAAS